jgi:hypothetical protein
LPDYVNIVSHAFNSEMDVKKEMTVLFWQARRGKVPTGIYPHLINNLRAIASLIREHRQAKQVELIEEKLAALKLMLSGTPDEQLPKWLRAPVIENGALVVVEQPEEGKEW